MSDNKWVAVDLDGTLLYYTNWKGMDGRLGKPRPGAKEFLTNIRKFAKVMIFTARLSGENVDYHKPCTSMMDALDEISDHLEKYDLPFDKIYTGTGKPVVEAYIDDRGVSIPKNPVEPDFDEALVKVKRFIEDI